MYLALRGYCREVDCVPFLARPAWTWACSREVDGSTERGMCRRGLTQRTLTNVSPRCTFRQARLATTGNLS